MFPCLPLAATPGSTAFFALPGQGPGAVAWTAGSELPSTGPVTLIYWLLHASVTTPESAPLLKTPVVKDETEIGAGGLCGLRYYTYQICREKELHCAVHCTLKHTHRRASA